MCVCVYMLQDHLAALMEVNEENETLMKQYDREKQRRKEIEEVLYLHSPVYLQYLVRCLVCSVGARILTPT